MPNNVTLERLLRMTVPIPEGTVGAPGQMPPDFRVAVQRVDEGGVHFVIHPNGHDGETLDFVASGNTLTQIPNR